MDKFILLTGSSGFIGKNLIKRLQSYNVICADLKDGFDVTDCEKVDNLFSTNKIDTVIHLAAIPGVGYSFEHSEEVLTNNIIGFDVLAKASVKHGCEHFIYASSSSVYGDDGIQKSSYAISKKTNELQAEMYSSLYNTKFTGLRLFTVYGRFIREDLGISKFIKAMRDDDYIHVYGDGNQSRDFTYVEDVCDAIISIVESDKTWKHEIFDVGYGKETKINDLISILKNQINPSFNKVVYENEKLYDVKRTLANPDKLYEWFGVKPKYDIYNGIHKWLSSKINTYIITVIKDEQDYLDYFIKYHLDIGIDHIFIFEDLYSSSHKEITEKYGDKVTLMNVSELFTKEELDRIILEKKHRRSTQLKSMKKGLEYVSNTYKDGWCFIIDCDEFITFEEKYKCVSDVMREFENYDAVYLQWENYGANGLVEKPDYTKSNITEIFTKKADCLKTDTLKYTTKIVYNLWTFKNENILSQHLSKDNIKWCKSDFSKDNKTIYDRIYLRHYLTKSFEEYLWKLNGRGMFNDLHRSVGDFFKVNEDMFYMKQELYDRFNIRR